MPQLGQTLLNLNGGISLSMYHISYKKPLNLHNITHQKYDNQTRITKIMTKLQKCLSKSGSTSN